MKQAQAVLNKEEATQEEINAAAKTLAEAQGKLVKVDKTKPSKPSKPSTSKPTKTADTAPILPMAGTAMAGLGIFAMLRRRRKEDK